MSPILTCLLCHHHCCLADGEIGFCRARQHQQGRLVSLSYGKLTSLALDPIEKKPLYHFHPGTHILSAGSFGCNLACPFCQNHEIAAGKRGQKIDESHLAEIFLKLQQQKANNINLVTTTQYVLPIIAAVKKAKAQGLKIPVVYNTSGYERVETLKNLEGIVDVYLPDFKYTDTTYAKRYSNAPDYFDVTKAALAEMVRQHPAPQFADKQEAAVRGIEEGIMTGGVIVRHLMLPGLLKDTKAVIRYLYETYGDSIYISIMNQYTPMPFVENIPELNRKVTHREYDKAVDYAIGLGVVNGFIQEGGTAKESFIPEFSGEGLE